MADSGGEGEDSFTNNVEVREGVLQALSKLPQKNSGCE